MGLNMEITVCEAQDLKAWDTYTEHSPKATFCHHSGWRSIIMRAYGHHPLYLAARSDGQTRGIFPLFEVKSRLFGKSLTSMPFLDYGGICADDKAFAHLLQEQALGLMQAHGVDVVELRQCEPVEQGASLRLDKVSMILDLSPGVEGLWRSFPGSVRNHVRKAQKSGLRTSIGGGELLAEFYPIFAANMRELGSPVHHRAFFAHIFAEFGPQAKLVLVRDGQRAVGGLVCLFFKDTATVPWSSSLRQCFSKCPNNLLYWEAMQYACARGCKRFDFGRSSVGSGTYIFKHQWGAQPVQIYWHLLGRNGNQSLAFSTNNPKYHIILETWKRLPLSVTKWLGPRIRKYLTN
jgi:serine/alanine adding enzyme